MIKLLWGQQKGRRMYRKVNIIANGMKQSVKRLPQSDGFTTAFVAFLGLVSAFNVSAADLLADEQGPTSPEAVATVTANEDFLLPSYVVPSSPETAPVPSEVDILKEIFGTPDPVPPVSKQPVVPQTASATPVSNAQQTFSPRAGVQCVPEKPLLTPLPPLPIIRAEAQVPSKKAAFTQANYADQLLAMAATPSESGVGMTREIRITFYPNQASFSAQALKWVKSFAVRVVNDPTLLAEVRFSEKNPKIQEKRLKVLLQILKEEGVSAHQIRLYKTARDENSILMGYTYNPEYRMGGKGEILNERTRKTIDW